MKFLRLYPSTLLITILSASLCCNAQQKEAVYTYTESQNDLYSIIFIDLEHYIELKVSTTKKMNSFSTSDQQFGEYRNALQLHSEVERDTLFIRDAINPLFQFPQDKLSAHKVTDSKAHVVLTENQVLFLNLSNANLVLEGNHKEIIVNIQDGNILLEKISGDIQIVSMNADVVGQGLSAYFFDISSRNGTTDYDKSIGQKKNQLKVESINGDIQLN